MSSPRRFAQTIAAVLLCSSAAAGAAVDKLAAVKAGTARETLPKDVADPIDGLQAATTKDLKTYCSSLKKEREQAEKDVAQRIEAARIADGSTVDRTKLVPTSQVDIRRPPPQKDPKTAAKSPEAIEARKQVFEAFVRRSTLTCLLYATREIQSGRTIKKAPATTDLVRRCQRKEVPDLASLDCEGDAPADPKK
jgi:hypothetical protein